jgi:hypothetical protein
MGQESPAGGVPLRREEISPVLADEPRPEESRGLGTARQIPELGHSADEEECEHGEPQCELVNPNTTEVDARTQSMPFQTQHWSTVVLDD